MKIVQIHPLERAACILDKTGETERMIVRHYVKQGLTPIYINPPKRTKENTEK